MLVMNLCKGVLSQCLLYNTNHDYYSDNDNISIIDNGYYIYNDKDNNYK